MNPKIKLNSAKVGVGVKVEAEFAKTSYRHIDADIYFILYVQESEKIEYPKSFQSMSAKCMMKS